MSSSPLRTPADAPALPFSLHVAGHCTVMERAMFKGGSYSHVEVPSLFALIKHPKHGYCLYDTGYSQENFRQTEKWPGSVYGFLVPITCNKGDSAKEQIEKVGVKAKEINYILISHFHGDHIGGLKDFPNAKFVYFRESLTKLERIAPLRQTLHGFLPGLMPDDFHQRAIALEFPETPADEALQPSTAIGTLVATPAPYEPLGPACIDLFDDGSMLIVSLPGHCTGQMGLIVRNAQTDVAGAKRGSAQSASFLMVGDACWDSVTIDTLAYPHEITFWVVHIDRPAYYRTIQNLNTVSKSGTVNIVPAHCRKLARTLLSSPWHAGHPAKL
ncbi:beta-lactamase-like protein [Powellomyces hirtus]|nr:beta-lactamase-like protein [Powellomyces hirtus]